MKPLKTVPDIKNTIPKLTWDGQSMKLFSMLKIRHLLLWDHYYLEIIELVTDEEFEAWRKSWLQKLQPENQGNILWISGSAEQPTKY